MEKLNTHYYDGKLNSRYNELVEKYKNEKINLQQSFTEIKTLINNSKSLNNKQKQIANIILLKLISDNGNYDNKNQINVHQLLPLVWTCVRKYDQSALDLFLEQLIEIKGGMCPQGRVARLLQMVDI